MEECKETNSGSSSTTSSPSQSSVYNLMPFKRSFLFLNRSTSQQLNAIPARDQSTTTTTSTTTTFPLEEEDHDNYNNDNNNNNHNLTLKKRSESIQAIGNSWKISYRELSIVSTKNYISLFDYLKPLLISGYIFFQ